MTSEQRKAILAALNNGSLTKAWKAGQAIMEEERDPGLLRGVVWTLRHGRAEHNRVEAAYRLRNMPGTLGIALCERILADANEPKNLRAYVAETLGNRHRPASHDVLLRVLKNDPSAEMRFWCAFTLGLLLRERRALPMLKWLAEHDHRVVKGWWKVSKEARDAIAEIERPTPKGWRRCMFCSREA